MVKRRSAVGSTTGDSVEAGPNVSGSEVTVGTDAAVLFVALDVPRDGAFSDNYVHLAAGEVKTVSFDDGDVSADHLSVPHLRATY